MRRTRRQRGDSKEELNMQKGRFDTRALTGLGLLTAVVVVLQLLGSFIRFGPFSISLVLIPIAKAKKDYIEHLNNRNNNE